MRPLVGDKFFRNACAHLFSLKRILRIARDLMMFTAFYDLPGDIAQTRAATWQALHKARGSALSPFLLMWLSVRVPRLFKVLFLYTLILARHPRQAASEVERLRKVASEHKVRRLQAGEGGAKKPRIYTSEDL